MAVEVNTRQKKEAKQLSFTQENTEKGKKGRNWYKIGFLTLLAIFLLFFGRVFEGTGFTPAYMFLYASAGVAFWEASHEAVS